MPILAALLSSAFTGLGALLSAIFGAQVAVRLAAVTALVGFSAALMVAFNALVAPLAAALFSTAYGQLLGLAFPPVAGTCLSVIAATWSAAMLFALQRRALSIVAG